MEAVNTKTFYHCPFNSSFSCFWWPAKSNKTQLQQNINKSDATTKIVNGQSYRPFVLLVLIKL